MGFAPALPANVVKNSITGWALAASYRRPARNSLTGPVAQSEASGCVPDADVGPEVTAPERV